MSQNSTFTIPCEGCHIPTPMLGTKLCDNCWEVASRIRQMDIGTLRRLVRRETQLVIRTIWEGAQVMTIIDTKGGMQHVPVPKPKDQLAVLQAAVGGYIELINLEGGRQLYVNEDGLRLGMPFNSTASVIARRKIVGNVVLVDKGIIK